MKLSSVREFLEKNKIFLEVFVATSLSFMAVYVSIQANKIAQNQTKIMEEENLPQLEIIKSNEYNDQIKIVDNNVWYFFNRGGKLSNFEIKEYTFFRFGTRVELGNDSIILPLYSYLSWKGTLTGESEGLIYQVDNNHNGVNEVKLRDSLLKFGFYEIASYVAVSYVDIFDKEHIEYFQISPGSRGRRVSQKTWKTVKAEFEFNENKYTFSRLNASDVIKMIRMPH
jgi:hypothetical protein